MRRTSTRIVALVLVAAFLSACRSLPIREQVVKSIQSASAAAYDAQDTERVLYAEGVLADLTPEKHRAFHAAFVTYLDAEYKLMAAVRRWSPGTPVPIDVTVALKAVHDALTALRPLVIPSAQKVLDYVLAAVEGMRVSIALSEAPKP